MGPGDPFSKALANLNGANVGTRKSFQSLTLRYLSGYLGIAEPES